MNFGAARVSLGLRYREGGRLRIAEYCRFDRGKVLYTGRFVVAIALL
jgi:hypothetical protein